MQAGYVNVFEDIPPSYNIAPQTFQPIVRLSRDTGERELTMMRWGLVPFWSKDGKAGFSTINAKAETLTTSPAFREAFQRRRCLVPAEWFYEWAKIDAKTKQPYAIALRDQSIFAFAGLWESWKDKATGERLLTYTIVTTDPNELIERQRLHNRMPVILAPKDYERWLAPAHPSHLPVDLLKPFPSDLMTTWKVSSAVGNVKNDEPSLVAPI
jgi:putative SOS response-associated peptidase YedK